MLSELWEICRPITINLLDIAIIAIATYKILDMLKGTRAEQLLKGLAILLIISVISERLGLTTVNWVLLQVQTMLIIGIPIVFQPELRRALEQLGKSSVLGRKSRLEQNRAAVTRNIEQIVRCLVSASQTKTGVLIAIERDIGLAEFIDTGIKINGYLTAELLGNIFIVNTPLHDGAVIINNDKILAASCYLPLSEKRSISKELGTRHRAGIGLSEVTDALVLIVSEETGTISVAEDGKLIRDIKEPKLRELLQRKLQKEEPSPNWLDKWRRNKQA